MPTLILPPRFSDDSIRVWRAATASGWDSLRLSGWRFERAECERVRERELAVYGEPLFVAAVAEQLGRVLLEPTFDWLPNLPERYRQRAVRAARFADLTAEHGPDGSAFSWPLFAKPADDKRFAARVYNGQDELDALSYVEPDTPVLISEPVHFSVEFRAFVLKRSIAAMSPYARDGDLCTTASLSERTAARRCLERLLGDASVGLPPAVVIDVGAVHGRDWAVIEANPCFGAGLYECDATAVLQVLARAVRRPAELSDQERTWVVAR